MPSRIFPFVNGQYYHIYNRGVEKRSVFEKSWDYSRLIKTMCYYQLAGPKPKLSKFLAGSIFKPDSSKKIVEVICYCLMSNHFHFLIKQLKDGGITEFISKLSNSYTKYYNVKYNRVGPLLQGEFKAVLIESDEQLSHASRYIHLNPIASFLVKDLNQYRWSSYREYIESDTDGICNKEAILCLFKSSKHYQQFVLDQVDYAQKLELIKHQLLDVED
ncbi:MAG: transposase [Candidatus Daviesbacteria bacterium]|nr:transposase [Candidatus Daviesbacteria bacterium]